MIDIGKELKDKIAKQTASRRGISVESVLEKMSKPTVVIMASSKCNLKCGHCYLPYTSNRSPKDALEMVEALQNNGYNVLVAGSENLLDLDYLKSYQKAGQKHILTNGLVLEKDHSIYDELKKVGINYIILSLHFGMTEEFKSVPERTVAKVIREAKERKFLVQATTTITSKNYLAVDSMCSKGVEYGLDKLHFGRFIQMGRGESENNLALSEIQAQEFFDNLNKVRKRYKGNLDVRVEGYFGPRPGSLGEELSKKGCYCPAGVLSFAVDPDDNVYGCPFTMGKNLVIGKYDNGKIKVDKIKLVTKLLLYNRASCIAHKIHS